MHALRGEIVASHSEWVVAEEKRQKDYGRNGMAVMRWCSRKLGSVVREVRI